MIYDMQRSPPRLGSLLEAMCLMVQMRREVARFLETMTITQAVRDDDQGEATQKAFERYRDSLMPFIKKQVVKEDERVKQMLHQEATRGPLRITPIRSEKKARSQLMERVNRLKNIPAAGIGRI